MLTFCPMDEAQARSILKWQYDPPYDLYDPGAGDVEETVQILLDPQYAYYALLTAEGELVAYCCFGADARVPGGDYGADALDVGLGVRPDLTGQGQGSAYVQAVLALARRTFSPSAFRVTIAEFNARALRVWEKAGFRRVQRFQRGQDGRAFLVLVREVARSGDRSRQE
jgi:ribosomal-protein-alanine N-acetyltransferase